MNLYVFKIVFFIKFIKMKMKFQYIKYKLIVDVKVFDKVCV